MKSYRLYASIHRSSCRLTGSVVRATYRRDGLFAVNLETNNERKWSCLVYGRDYNLTLVPSTCVNRTVHQRKYSSFSHDKELVRNAYGKLGIGQNSTTKGLLKLLNEADCDFYELFEWPEVLNLGHGELVKMLEYLGQNNLPVSVGLLKCIKPTDAASKMSFQRYHQNLLGHKSVGDCIADKLGYSKDQVLKLFIRSPSIAKRRDIGEKVKLLQYYGIDVDTALTTRIFMFSNTSLRTRCEQLSSLRVEPPWTKYLKMNHQAFQSKVASLNDFVKEQELDETDVPQNDSIWDNLRWLLRKIDIHIEENENAPKNLKFLEDNNCTIVEVLEWPEILKLDHQQLLEGASYLTKRGYEISVGYLKRVCTYTRKHVPRALRNYRRLTHGNKSACDYLIQVLGCNQKELFKLLARWPGIMMSMWSFGYKVSLLKEYDVDVDSILKYGHKISTRHLDEMRRRCTIFSSVGLTPPPLRYVTSLPAQFDDMFNSLQKELPKGRQLAELLNINLGKLLTVFDKENFFPQCSLHEVHSSAEYLIEKRNYTTGEVKNDIEVLKIGVGKLQNSVTDLESALTIKPIPLDLVLSYASLNIKNGRPHRKSHYLKDFLTVTKNISAFLPSKKQVISNVSKKDIILNMFFLMHVCKFSRTEIGTLPVLLLHDPEALQQQWSNIMAETEKEVLENLFKHPENLLHLLQYYLEQSTNFRHTFVLKKNSHHGQITQTLCGN